MRAQSFKPCISIVSDYNVYIFIRKEKNQSTTQSIIFQLSFDDYNSMIFVFLFLFFIFIQMTYFHELRNKYQRYVNRLIDGRKDKDSPKKTSDSTSHSPASAYSPASSTSSSSSPSSSFPLSSLPLSLSTSSDVNNSTVHHPIIQLQTKLHGKSPKTDANGKSLKSVDMSQCKGIVRLQPDAINVVKTRVKDLNKSAACGSTGKKESHSNHSSKRDNSLVAVDEIEKQKSLTTKADNLPKPKSSVDGAVKSNESELKSNKRRTQSKKSVEKELSISANDSERKTLQSNSANGIEIKTTPVQNKAEVNLAARPRSSKLSAEHAINQINTATNTTTISSTPKSRRTATQTSTQTSTRQQIGAFDQALLSHPASVSKKTSKRRSVLTQTATVSHERLEQPKPIEVLEISDEPATSQSKPAIIPPIEKSKIIIFKGKKVEVPERVNNRMFNCFVDLSKKSYPKRKLNGSIEIQSPVPKKKRRKNDKANGNDIGASERQLAPADILVCNLNKRTPRSILHKADRSKTPLTTRKRVSFTGVPSPSPTPATPESPTENDLEKSENKVQKTNETETKTEAPQTITTPKNVQQIDKNEQTTVAITTTSKKVENSRPKRKLRAPKKTSDESSSKPKPEVIAVNESIVIESLAVPTEPIDEIKTDHSISKTQDEIACDDVEVPVDASTPEPNRTLTPIPMPLPMPTQALCDDVDEVPTESVVAETNAIVSAPIEEPVDDVVVETINNIPEAINSVDVPMNIVDEPVESVEQPAKSVEHPAESVDEPVECVLEPVESDEQPIENVLEPTNIDDEPISSVDEPMNSVDVPNNNFVEPFNSEQESINIVDQLIESVVETVNSISEPMYSVDDEQISCVEETISSYQEPAVEEFISSFEEVVSTIEETTLISSDTSDIQNKEMPVKRKRKPYNKHTKNTNKVATSPVKIKAKRQRRQLNKIPAQNDDYNAKVDYFVNLDDIKQNIVSENVAETTLVRTHVEPNSYLSAKVCEENDEDEVKFLIENDPLAIESEACSMLNSNSEPCFSPIRTPISTPIAAQTPTPATTPIATPTPTPAPTPTPQSYPVSIPEESQNHIPAPVSTQLPNPVSSPLPMQTPTPTRTLTFIPTSTAWSSPVYHAKSTETSSKSMTTAQVIRSPENPLKIKISNGKVIVQSDVQLCPPHASPENGTNHVTDSPKAGVRNRGRRIKKKKIHQDYIVNNISSQPDRSDSDESPQERNKRTIMEWTKQLKLHNSTNVQQQPALSTINANTNNHAELQTVDQPTKYDDRVFRAYVLVDKILQPVTSNSNLNLNLISFTQPQVTAAQMSQAVTESQHHSQVTASLSQNENMVGNNGCNAIIHYVGENLQQQNGPNSMNVIQNYMNEGVNTDVSEAFNNIVNEAISDEMNDGMNDGIFDMQDSAICENVESPTVPIVTDAGAIIGFESPATVDSTTSGYSSATATSSVYLLDTHSLNHQLEVGNSFSPDFNMQLESFPFVEIQTSDIIDILGKTNDCGDSLNMENINLDATAAPADTRTYYLTHDDHSINTINTINTINSLNSVGTVAHTIPTLTTGNILGVFRTKAALKQIDPLPMHLYSESHGQMHGHHALQHSHAFSHQNPHLHGMHIHGHSSAIPNELSGKMLRNDNPILNAVISSNEESVMDMQDANEFCNSMGVDSMVTSSDTVAAAQRRPGLNVIFSTPSKRNNVYLSNENVSIDEFISESHQSLLPDNFPTTTTSEEPHLDFYTLGI